MRSAAVVGAALATVIAQAGAFRHRPKGSRIRAGTVDLLYTFGAPSTGKPAIKNPQSTDGCFPGLRLWSSNRGAGDFGEDEVDIIPSLAHNLGYRHAYMDGVDLEVGEGKQYHKKCSEEHTTSPPGWAKAYLHASKTYIEEASKLDALAMNVSQIALKASYFHDEQEAARHASSSGWGLVQTAYNDDGATGDPQVAHLLQNPDNLECVITFQGKDSFQDWLTEDTAAPVDFCGLDEEVHKGFRNHLRRLVRTDAFQSRIRPYLKGCAKVIATGHSLGGAMAELFAACLARAPSRGAPGWDSDYQYLSWKVGDPTRMEYTKTV